MSLLDFALGPALRVALIVFAGGVVWRLVGVLLLARHRGLARPKDRRSVRGGLRTIFARFWTHPAFSPPSVGHMTVAYVYHVAFALVLFLFVPHIQFWGSVFGFTWGGMPNPAITGIAGAGVAALVVALVRRLTNPVLRTISTFDDYFSWLTLFLPFATGMLATAHLALPYPQMLGVHVLSVDLMLVWFPFGKLMHTFFFVPSRYALGADYRRRGVIA